jgi:drug/metabolite transporter (DMT)-like permease
MRHYLSAGPIALPWSEICALGSGLLAGAALVVIRQLRLGPDPEKAELIVFCYAGVAIVGSLILCTLYGEWRKPTPYGLAVLLLLGLANLGAQWFMTFGLRLNDTVLGALLLNCQSVIVAALGWFFFNESYPPNTLIGAAIILGAGIWLSSTADRKRNTGQTVVPQEAIAGTESSVPGDFE